MSRRAPSVLYLHIGRGKTGTSSIQTAIRNNSGSLAAQGFVTLPGAENTAGNSVTLARALNGAPGDEHTLAAFSTFVAANRTAKVVASSEFFFDRGERQLKTLRDALVGELRILGYLRPYPEWVRSLYFQDVRKGRCLDSFDSFLASMRDRVSFRPYVERWMSTFGNATLRLRHLSTLNGRSVVADFAAALGLAIDDQNVVNASPHWVEIEFTRAMHLCESNPGELQRPETRILQAVKVVRKALRDLSVGGDAVYMTRRDAKALEEEYRRDAAWLHAALGVPLPARRKEPFPDRPFAPSLASVPIKVRDVIRKRMEDAEALRELPYLRQTVSRVWDFWAPIKGEA